MKLKSSVAIRVAVFILGSFMFLFGWMVITIGIDEYEADKQFQLYGVQTHATLIGYRYFKAGRRSPAGDRPVYAYTSSNGVTHTHIAFEYGVVNPSQKKDFENQEVIISYLSNNPPLARVEKWQSKYGYVLYIIVGLFSCLISLAFAYTGYKSTKNI